MLFECCFLMLQTVIRIDAKDVYSTAVDWILWNLMFFVFCSMKLNVFIATNLGQEIVKYHLSAYKKAWYLHYKRCSHGSANDGERDSIFCERIAIPRNKYHWRNFARTIFFLRKFARTIFFLRKFAKNPENRPFHEIQIEARLLLGVCRVNGNRC